MTAIGIIERKHTEDRITEHSDAFDAERPAHRLEIGGKHVERQIGRIAR